MSATIPDVREETMGGGRGDGGGMGTRAGCGAIVMAVDGAGAGAKLVELLVVDDTGAGAKLVELV